MKGLILKDLINLKRQGKVIGLMLVFYIVLSLASENTPMFGGIIMIMCAMLPITAMAYDERAKWDKYALTMPVSRKDMVISKYLLGLAFACAAFLVYLVFSLIASLYTIKETLFISLGLLAVGIIFMSVILPIIFKFGVEKARLLMLLVLFVPTGLIVLASKMGLKAPGEDTVYAMAYASPVVVIAFLIVSAVMSLKIYANKEF